MTNKELAQIMYPNVNKNITDYEKIYPKRNLPEGAVVSRYAPSPTGFVHMGNMLSCFIENFVPKKTNGVFYLRIEDTDQKREVEKGIENIINALKIIGLDYNEGVISADEQKGDYGPYIQTQRQEIYDTFAKYMIENDLAYPCFCTSDNLEEIRKTQKVKKERIGYYGKYAKCRNLTNEEKLEKIKSGIPYTLRLKSKGNFNNKIEFNDLVKGKVSFPENDQDIILIKSDGIPVYHFAHLVDDHLMRTTHVLRGEDWLSSIPVHLELFKMFNFTPPKYAHLGLVMLVDEKGNKRKISKRKDQNYAIKHFEELGIPKNAMQEYLMTIANTNFEAWKNNNPDKSINEFEFTFSKVGSNPLFDYTKLLNISKNYLANLSAKEVFDGLFNWAQKFDLEFFKLIEVYKDYTTAILNIEREQKKPRKDFAMYSDVLPNIWYMYDEYFDKNELEYEFQEITDKEEIKNILNNYLNIYSENDDKEEWFNKIKELCDKLGYASNMKDYKENKENYKGSVADVSTVLRVALTSKHQTPDLYEIMKLIGKEKMQIRYKKFCG